MTNNHKKEQMVKWKMTENSANDKEKNPGPVGPGEPGTGLEFPAAQDEQMALRKKSIPHLVERATALRGQGIGRPPEPKSSRRRRTRMDIYGKDPEIPFVKFEAAARDLVCSLMERQDRMNEEIFYRINDLAYRLEDLEQDRSAAGGGS
jgi:hypothetical protein